MYSSFCIEALEEAIENYGHLKYLTQIRALNTQALSLLKSSKAIISKFLWMAKAGGLIMYLLRDYGNI